MTRSAGPPPVARAEGSPQEDINQRALTIVEAMGKPATAENFRSLLGSDKAYEHFKAVALHAINSNTDLLRRATATSIVEACRDAATLGLEPTGLTGDGWLILYNDTAKFQPGWRGYLKLVRRSGEVRIVDTQIVYENDEFDITLGTNPSIQHKPKILGDRVIVEEDPDRPTKTGYIVDRGGVKGAYAWARLTNGETFIEWMTWADIDATRRVSPSVKANRPSPWDDWWGEMARKTVLRRLVKRLPLEAFDHAEKALAIDNEIDNMEAAAIEEARPSSARAAALAGLENRGLIEPPADGEVVDVELEQTEQGAVVDQPDEDAGSTETATAPDEAEAEPPAPEPEPKAPGGRVCDDLGPYDDKTRCTLAWGHRGPHKGAAGKAAW